MFELPPPKVYICDMDITCCLPNLAFHTPMLALLSFCRVHSSKMNANDVDSRKSWLQNVSRLFLAFGQPADQYPSSRWILLKDHHESSSGTYNSVLEGAHCQYGFVCSVHYLLFENCSFRVNTCDKKLPNSLVGILNPGLWQNSRRDTQKRMQKEDMEAVLRRFQKYTLELRPFVSTRIQRLLAEPASQSHQCCQPQQSWRHLWRWKFH